MLNRAIPVLFPGVDDNVHAALTGASDCLLVSSTALDANGSVVLRGHYLVAAQLCGTSPQAQIPMGLPNRTVFTI